jgi:hypothetical protein
MTLPRQVTTRNVFREKLLAMMADNDFAEGGGFYRVLGDRHDWPLHILNLPSLTPALENALLALCTSRLGRHTGQSALVRESLKLYTQGVSQARRDLLHESTRKDEQSLAACMTLLSYETLECPGGSLDGYQTHYRGCLELLELGGAFRYTSGLARATLQILRLHTVRQLGSTDLGENS